ncbi:hypothetical protein [Salinimicrobium xinjiangense]|uniref:hypothetical protein n=1 Tax=Salinimicrobium xinjiangense TaxID=438596 RepID=UPI00048B317F|nr:hypothetical protein [Salinimicrobium xinjiangense]
MTAKNYIFYLITALILISCEKEETINYRDIVGFYELRDFHKLQVFETESSTRTEFTYLRNMCTINSSLEVKGDGTFQKIDYRLVEEECIIVSEENGVWKKTLSNYGNFVGEFMVNNSNKKYDAYGHGEYTTGEATSIDFDLGSTASGDKIMYKMTYLKVIF